MTARAWLMVIIVFAVLQTVAAQAADVRQFDGFRALVVEPEHSWGWVCAILCALEEKGFEVTYGRIPEDPAALARYALVALNIKRHLTDAEARSLQQYVADGGAVYGSWGGPMGTPRFLTEVCKVGRTKSVWIKQIVLLESPLTKGIPHGVAPFPQYVGHQEVGARGFEIVTVQPLAGGIAVAKDAAGNDLGVLNQYGKGRTAVLGFGPEQDKRWVDPDLGPAMLDNLLAWLLEQKIEKGERTWSSRISVALPARVQVHEVYVNGQRLPEPAVKQVGSVKTVELDVRGVTEGKEAAIRITYEPLSAGRNVETVVHLPWGTLRAAAESPARLAEYLDSLNVTLCQPLLRSSFGHAWYKGMPQDQHDDELVKEYKGDFLADFVNECHTRGIKVVAGIYFDNAEPVRKYPEVVRIDRQGNPIKNRWGSAEACFNNPKGQEHNLATVQHLLDNYDLDGIILDDNFELDKKECYCQYCKDGFRKYCEARGMPYRDPSEASDLAMGRHWRDYRQEATRALAAKVRSLTNAHGVPAGGWTGASMDSMHLAAAFDFLGGMVYTQPPRAARGPLSVLGDRKFICLLWAPNTDPQTMAREVREAVHSGCAAVGFWTRGDDGGYEMDAERSAVMRQALGSVEEEWLRFYKDNIVSGDGRFVVVSGSLGPKELTLRIRNTGSKADSRIQGLLDLSALGLDH